MRASRVALSGTCSKHAQALESQVRLGASSTPGSTQLVVLALTRGTATRRREDYRAVMQCRCSSIVQSLVPPPPDVVDSAHHSFPRPSSVSFLPCCCSVLASPARSLTLRPKAWAAFGSSVPISGRCRGPECIRPGGVGCLAHSRLCLVQGPELEGFGSVRVWAGQECLASETRRVVQGPADRSRRADIPSGKASSTGISALHVHRSSRRRQSDATQTRHGLGWKPATSLRARTEAGHLLPPERATFCFSPQVAIGS